MQGTIKKIWKNEKNTKYVITTEGGEVTATSMKPFSGVSEGSEVEFEVKQNGQYTNIVSMSAVGEAPKSYSSSKSNGSTLPKSQGKDQDRISRQFLMNFTREAKIAAMAEDKTFSEYMNEFAKDFKLAEEFLFNNAPVTKDEVAGIVENNLESKIKAIAKK